jgi:hypothetical protein
MPYDINSTPLDAPSRNFVVLASSGYTFAADRFCRAIIAWTTGTLSVVSVGGSTGALAVSAAPFVIPIQCSQISSVSGTFWALYD